MQFVYGSPCQPVGQWHSAIWFFTLQYAFPAQGFLTSHGPRHCLLMQALVSSQSRFEMQSIVVTGRIEV